MPTDKNPTTKEQPTILHTLEKSSASLEQLITKLFELRGRLYATQPDTDALPDSGDNVAGLVEVHSVIINRCIETVDQMIQRVA